MQASFAGRGDAYEKYEKGTALFGSLYDDDFVIWRMRDRTDGDRTDKYTGGDRESDGYGNTGSDYAGGGHGGDNRGPYTGSNRSTERYGIADCDRNTGSNRSAGSDGNPSSDRNAEADGYAVSESTDR